MPSLSSCQDCKAVWMGYGLTSAILASEMLLFSSSGMYFSAAADFMAFFSSFAGVKITLTPAMADWALNLEGSFRYSATVGQLPPWFRMVRRKVPKRSITTIFPDFKPAMICFMMPSTTIRQSSSFGVQSSLMAVAMVEMVSCDTLLARAYHFFGVYISRICHLYGGVFY